MLQLFYVTRNKADKDYSPTTMHKDYSINKSLFHWQSQSTTAEASATGQREAECCCLSGSLRRTPVLTVQRRTPIWAP